MKCRATRGFSSLFLMLAACLAGAGEPAPAANGGDSLPVVKLAPKVREASRDRGFFEHLPCEQVDAIRPANAEESAWLEARRAACVQRYQGYGHGYMQ